MVLVDIPLWLNHGHPPLSSCAAAAMSSSSMMGNVNNSNTGSSARNNHDIPEEAEQALAVLKCGHGSRRAAPIYAIDIHPDGTKFATAAGDGNVRIWSTASLFDGRMVNESSCKKDLSQNHNRHTDINIERRVSNRFTQGGVYISSNSEEDYDENSSSSLEDSECTAPITNVQADVSTENTLGNHNNPLDNAQSYKISQGQVHPQTNVIPEVVNDLTGLVRKKMKENDDKRIKPSTAKRSPSTSAIIPTLEKYNSFPVNDNSTTAQPSATSAQNLTINMSATNPTSVQNTIKINSNCSQWKKQKLLSTISSAHTGSVLSLRFSHSGHYLATSGDDSYVNIYARSATPSLASKGNLVGVDSHGNVGTNGSSDGVRDGASKEDVEHWNRVAVCRGHHLDVVGLAWAPDDTHLVSCSLDSAHPVIVWKLVDVLSIDMANNNKQPEGGTALNHNCSGITHCSAFQIHNLHPFKILGRKEHTSTVKGVAFDPAGKYIATSADDPAICIWRAFDDWGLEARIDASSGVFRSKKRRRRAQSADRNTAADNEQEIEEDDPGELATLSLFRRISFAPDGSHLCGTNASLRGKNIAAMISRQGWATSGPKPPSNENGENIPQKNVSNHHPPGAANLVGHKQPVVSSRHCPIIFEAPKKSSGKTGSSSEDFSDDVDDNDSDPDTEPDYAMLVALGDKRGFVTVWSTKMSRPLLKLQCSGSRCTVTDISWGFLTGKLSDRVDKADSLFMIVSLLDGYVVAIKFSIPEEVGGGGVLSVEKQRKIFRLRYGIEDFEDPYFSSTGVHRCSRRLVDNIPPVLIENATQLILEMENDEKKNESFDKETLEKSDPTQLDTKCLSQTFTEENTVEIKCDLDERSTTVENKRRKKSKVTQDHMKSALDAATLAEKASAKAMNRLTLHGGDFSHTTNLTTGSNGGSISSTFPASLPAPGLGPPLRIPYVVNKIYRVDLVSISTSSQMFSSLDHTSLKIVADCVNSQTTTLETLPSATLSISRGGIIMWKDILAKTVCTALAASINILAVGAADGSLHLYGTSPTTGWKSAKSFRAFPPFILGCAVVQISFRDCDKMIIVTSDGCFFVYKFLSLGPELEYRGSILPPMQHLILSSNTDICRSQEYIGEPKLARIQVTDSNQLLLILSIKQLSTAKSLHAFVYNRSMKLWMRVSESDSFLFSDFYSSLPRTPKKENKGELGLLTEIDNITRSIASTESAKSMFKTLSENEKQPFQSVVSRAHCEDRLACAIAVGSASDFQMWLSCYARCISSCNDVNALRFLVDILLGRSLDSDSMETDLNTNLFSWWFNAIGQQGLGLDTKDVIRHIILPEIGKNRLLQRLTNELMIELDCL